jgi:Fe-S oxidoreductase
VLANIPGDKKAVACIEDTAVDVQDLPDYMDDFAAMMKSFNQEAIYYAHAGAGEIHLRPILDLKTTKGKEDFYNISKSTAELVKKYRGSLSGEHGDGRVRAPFIPLVMGEDVYKLFSEIKQIWDPDNIFNPGKIVNALPMQDSLRTDQICQDHALVTKYNFQEAGGMLRLAEKCNGSGDCRKLPLSGGTMCPSYHATRDEKDSTRARANVLRELLTAKGKYAFSSQELADVLDLCLACKACTSECPSNVNMTLLKSESLYQRGLLDGFPLRSKIFGNFGRLFHLGSKLPKITNWVLQGKWVQIALKSIFGIAKERSLPIVANTTLRKWIKTYQQSGSRSNSVYLFCDEFTNYLEPQIGVKAVKLLNAIGYYVKVIDHPESGRASMSRGLLDHAAQLAEENIKAFRQLINDNQPLIGIEPSAILSFREEYPRLASAELRDDAQKLKKNTFLIEEFLAILVEEGKIKSNIFDTKPRNIIYHGHCHQKSLSQEKYALQILSIPSGHTVTRLDTGCCGMAGSFGYEKEHIEISKKIANISLIPSINNAETSTTIVASGTSCRHQIKDMSARRAFHPVEVLHSALVN